MQLVEAAREGAAADLLRATEKMAKQIVRATGTKASHSPSVVPPHNCSRSPQSRPRSISSDGRSKDSRLPSAAVYDTDQISSPHPSPLMSYSERASVGSPKVSSRGPHPSPAWSYSEAASVGSPRVSSRGLLQRTTRPQPDHIGFAWSTMANASGSFPQESTEVQLTSTPGSPPMTARVPRSTESSDVGAASQPS